MRLVSSRSRSSFRGLAVMKQRAVEQAREKLARAERAVETLQSATSFETAREAWVDFLHAASGLYSKLEQGSKSNGRSMGWFGQKKKERRSDPLLRYLHFARNSDQHGLRLITELEPGSAAIQGKQLPFGERRHITIIPVDPVTGQPQPDKAAAAFVPGPSLRLIRAHDDRFHDFCDPPKEHLGRPITNHFPNAVAVLGLFYLKDLVAEAEELV